MNALHYSSPKSIFLIAFFTLIPFLSKAQSNVLLYGGNAFYWSDGTTDYSKQIDAETGEVVSRIRVREAAFNRMNADTIYNIYDEGTAPPVFNYKKQTVAQYLQTIFQSKMEFHDVPSFSIDKIVINKIGKLVYFELQFDDIAQSKALKLKWGSLIERQIRMMPTWTPGIRYGKPVLYYLNDYIHVEMK